MSAADRARAERAAQGLPTPAAPIGDDEVDARVARAYRTTATLLAIAIPVSSRASAVAVEEPGIGAAGGSGELTRNASDRSTNDRKAGVGAPALQDNAG